MATMGRTFEYYPSSPFLPSVALGTLLTTKRLALKMLTHFRLYIYNPPKSSFEKEDFKVDA